MSTTIDIEWADPPPAKAGAISGTHHGAFIPFFEALRQNPGQWAIFRRATHQSTATNIRRGKYLGCEADEFEVTCRMVGSNKADVYVRYPEQAEQEFQCEAMLLRSGGIPDPQTLCVYAYAHQGRHSWDEGIKFSAPGQTIPGDNGDGEYTIDNVPFVAIAAANLPAPLADGTKIYAGGPRADGHYVPLAGIDFEQTIEQTADRMNSIVTAAVRHEIPATPWQDR